MARTNFTLTVGTGNPGGDPIPIPNAPVILFNQNMTINRVGFTYEDGVYVFVKVKPGEYFLMVMDTENSRYQMLAQVIDDRDPDRQIMFPDDPADKGKIIAMVKVGGANAGDRLVRLYTSGGTVPIMQKDTDPDPPTKGRVEFDGLTGGTYDVEAVTEGGNPPCQDQRQNGFSVTSDAGSVANVPPFNFAAGC